MYSIGLHLIKQKPETKTQNKAFHLYHFDWFLLIGLLSYYKAFDATWFVRIAKIEENEHPIHMSWALRKWCEASWVQEREKKTQLVQFKKMHFTGFAAVKHWFAVKGWRTSGIECAPRNRITYWEFSIKLTRWCLCCCWCWLLNIFNSRLAHPPDTSMAFCQQRKRCARFNIDYMAWVCVYLLVAFNANKGRSSYKRWL